MKKIISILAVLALLFVTTSCDNNSMSLLYDVTVSGDADGDVNITFPNGVLDINGTAGLDFVYSNVPDSLKTKGAYDLEKALQANDDKLLKAAEAVDEAFSATAASGTYYVGIKGYVKEPNTGIIFLIDKEFTNRADSIAVAETKVEEVAVDAVTAAAAENDSVIVKE